MVSLYWNKSLNVCIHVGLSVSWEFTSWLYAKNPRLNMTTKGVPYSWEISQPDGNDEGTDISKYSSLGAPVIMSHVGDYTNKKGYSGFLLVLIKCFLSFLRQDNWLPYDAELDASDVFSVTEDHNVSVCFSKWQLYIILVGVILFFNFQTRKFTPFGCRDGLFWFVWWSCRWLWLFIWPHNRTLQPNRWGLLKEC